MLKTLNPQINRVTSNPFRNQVELQAGLSELVIPAVKGEFYSYSSVFTIEKPLYVFMKCKANKSRIVGSATQLGREVNLFFQFGRESHARLCSIKDAQVQGLLGDSVNEDLFGENWVSATTIPPADFYCLRSRIDPTELVNICERACNLHETSVDIEPGMVVAMMTDEGKYGMFLVKELTSVGILIDACHILV